MAYDVPMNHQKCATCRWWSGDREVVFVGRDAKYVRVGGISPAVDCHAWSGRKYGAAATCFRWSKWEKL